MKHTWILFLGFILICGSCEKNSLDEDNGEKKPLSEEISDIAEAQRATSWELLRESYKSGENSLISPFSIQYALYMASGAADKETLTQMQEVLNIMDIENPHEAAAELADYLRSDRDGRSISIANSCFYDPHRLALDDNYAQLLKDHYMDSIEQAYFDREEAIDKINAWAEKATHGKIKEVLEKIEEEEILFLLNALYMKADWDHGFDEEQTMTGTFTSADGNEQSAEFMFMDNYFRAFKDENISYLELPLSDSTLRCTFILPETGAMTAQLDMLNESKIEEYRDKAVRSRYQIKVPKLKLKYKKVINPWMENLGMTDAFSEEKADFEKMGRSNGNIYITRILHDTYFEMDEGGIEGAAVTTVGFGAESLPPHIALDRPFILIVSDLDTGVPIFSGIIQTMEE